MGKFNIIKDAEKYIEDILEVVINVPWDNEETCVNGIYPVVIVKNTEWFKQFETEDGSWFVPNLLLENIPYYVCKEGKYYMGMALFQPSETYLYSHKDLYECIFHTIYSDDLLNYYLKNKNKLAVEGNKITLK